MKSLRAFLLLALTFSPVARADYQTWLGAFYETGWGTRWLASGEIQDRMGGSFEQQRLLLRTALGFRLGESHSVWLGYAWTPTFQPSFRSEQRLWQQSRARYTWPEWQLEFRFRMEERFVEGAGALNLRWRELFRVSYHPYGTWGFVLWDEFFFNLTTNTIVTKRGFEQNRLFLGARLPICEEMALEPGYMNHIQHGLPMAHTAVVFFSWNTPHSKTQNVVGAD